MAGNTAALLTLREEFKLPALVAFAAHLVYMRTLIGIRAARLKHRIFAPAMSGNPDFDRVIRVQANFVEQFPAFITSMFFCTLFESGTVAAALGAVWVVFRAAYGERYSARRLSLDIFWYTVPQYAVIAIMYLLPLLRIIPTLV